MISEKHNNYLAASTKRPLFHLPLKALLREFDIHNIGWRFGLDHDKDNPFIVSGPKRVMEEISRYKEGYAGAVLLPLRADMVVPWVDRLGSLGKPVVWMDSFLMKGLSPTGPPHFFRITYNNDSAVAQALEVLNSHGHTKIGIPLFTEYAGHQYNTRWVTSRIAAIRRCAAQFFPGIPIDSVEAKESFWQLLPSGGDSSIMESSMPSQRIGVLPGQTIQPKRALWLDKTESMRVLLLDKKVTALIALNDRMVREIRLWCFDAGIDIPDALSVVSFDNSPLADLIQVDSVDFMLENRGYLAAHCIIGDMKIARQADGVVPGTSRLVRRGTVGQPGGVG